MSTLSLRIDWRNRTKLEVLVNRDGKCTPHLQNHCWGFDIFSFAGQNSALTVEEWLVLWFYNLSIAVNPILEKSYYSYVYWNVHHLDSWVKRDQLDVTCFIIYLFNAQHVSDVNTSKLRSLRLICWVISWVVLIWFDVCWCYVVVWLWWCGIRMQVEAKPQRNTNTHRTRSIQPMK